MTKDKKISKIYEVIANKELSFGCVVNHFGRKDKVVVNVNQDKSIDYVGIDDGFAKIHYILEEDYMIVGHPVMIGDVMDWTFEERDYQYTLAQDDNGKSCYEIDERMGELFRLREYKRKPIEEQSEECIDFVFNLID